MLTRGDPDNSQWRGDDGPQRYSEAENVEDVRYRLRTIKRRNVIFKQTIVCPSGFSLRRKWLLLAASGTAAVRQTTTARAIQATHLLLTALLAGEGLARSGCF
jgi:hypothetical protein